MYEATAVDAAGEKHERSFDDLGDAKEWVRSTGARGGWVNQDGQLVYGRW